MKAHVIYERQDAFDIKIGPYGYERVGFSIGDRVFWTGCAGTGLSGETYEHDKRLAETIVARWNAGERPLRASAEQLAGVVCDLYEHGHSDEIADSLEYALGQASE